MNIKLAASIVACAALFAGPVVAQERTQSGSANVAAEKAKSDSAKAAVGKTKSSPVSGFGSGTGMGVGGGSGSSTSMSGGGSGSGMGSGSYTPGAPGTDSLLPPGTSPGMTGGAPKVGY